MNNNLLKTIKTLSCAVALVGTANAAAISNSDILAGPVAVTDSGLNITVTMSPTTGLTVHPNGNIVTNTNVTQYTFNLSFTSANVDFIDGTFQLGGMQTNGEFWDITDGGSTVSLTSTSTDINYNATTGRATSPSGVDGAEMFDFSFTGLAAGSSLSFTSDNKEFFSQFIGNFTVDNFTVVPEPTSTALLGLGSLVFLARRKRA